MFNTKDIEKKLLRGRLLLPSFENLYLDRAAKIAAHLNDRTDRLNIKCENCYERLARKSYILVVYKSPFRDDVEVLHFCSTSCLDLYSERVFICDECSKTYWINCSLNSLYRIVDDSILCLSCYQNEILENGIPLQELEKGSIPGMFFSYGNTECLEAGYIEHDRVFVNSYNRNHIISRIKNLIKAGKQVVIAYERLAIGGSEGHITIYTKRSEKQ